MPLTWKVDARRYFRIRDFRREGYFVAIAIRPDGSDRLVSAPHDSRADAINEARAFVERLNA